MKKSRVLRRRERYASLYTLLRYANSIKMYEKIQRYRSRLVDEARKIATETYQPAHNDMKEKVRALTYNWRFLNANEEIVSGRVEGFATLHKLTFVPRMGAATLARHSCCL